MLENVKVKDGELDFNDSSITKNGRASYSTDIIANAHHKGYVNKHPKNIVMLTCDAFGVLPPVSLLSPDEAIEHFLLGYTAKVAGTESGVTEPQPTFSPCFGGPFMPLSPEEYGELLREKIYVHNVKCWLVNTGWTGGPVGEGYRINLWITREIIQRIIDGSLVDAAYIPCAYTDLLIPAIQYIPMDVLYPHLGWADINNYKKQAKKLMNMMRKALTK
jgi:phosphoenolpyruvate carboxykinase (ATP)